jgi:hypothetical protein
MGLPFCTQFYFYDTHISDRAKSFKDTLRKFFRCLPDSTRQAVNVIKFEFSGLRRTVHFLKEDNLNFLQQDVDLAFYFHRGDSQGEGGSGQNWDSELMADLLQKVAKSGVCQVLTDGQPGGLRSDILSEMQTFTSPISHRRRKYFFGQISDHLAKNLEKNNS